MIGRIFLGRYEAVRLLGEGGMGKVWLARQLDLARPVVVKVMHEHIAAEPKFRERFQRETLLMARFQHPYAVTLYDASLDDPEGPCIVMEYIRGVSLDGLLQRNGRLSPARVGRLLGQLCEVLQAAHAQGIVHRDLKPGNLMIVDADTPYEKVKVMDFGLAKLFGPPAARKPTETEGDFAVGTPAYICPEQVRGQPMDHRGDLYSLGVILYELLTGRLPFADRMSMDLLLAQATEPPPSFAEIGAADVVPPRIEEVVFACLAKEPDGRPANARELAERYETALAHDQVVRETELRPTPPPLPIDRVKAAARWAVQPDFGPGAIVRHLQAWMPEAIASHKLHGFVHDAGGKVAENVPGRIRVQLGHRGSFLGLGRRNDGIDLELHLQTADSDRGSLLRVTAVMRPLSGRQTLDDGWRARCDRLYCDLRAYLMGHTGALDQTPSLS